MITIGNKKYLEIKDYAAYKLVHVKTVYEWIKEKKVETRNLLGKTLIKL